MMSSSFYQHAIICFGRTKVGRRGRRTRLYAGGAERQRAGTADGMIGRDCRAVRVTRSIKIDEAELHVSFIRAPGPGGQKVNKTASAVQLQFDASRSPSLPEDVKRRLLKLAGRRATRDGRIVIEAKRCRSQQRNRNDARRRLAEMIRKAARPPARRKKTRPTAASKRKRLEEKRRRGQIKQLRRPPQRDE